MRISHRHRFVFLSLPRAASLSVRKLLEPYSDTRSVDQYDTSVKQPFWHHMRAAELKKIFSRRGWDWEKYRIFCMVRNPFSRVVSAYKYHCEELSGWVKSESLSKSIQVYAFNKLSGTPTFKEYVGNIDPRADGLTISLEAFITGKSDTILVDDILRFEKLPDNVIRYLSRHGISIDRKAIPHHHKSDNRDDYMKWYDKESRDIVRQKYKYAIERFGYTYG